MFSPILDLIGVFFLGIVLAGLFREISGWVRRRRAARQQRQRATLDSATSTTTISPQRRSP